MKKTQIKDAVRNIKKQIVSYLSIIFISMLAVLTYLGINYAAAAIKMNSGEFFENRNFRDVEIFSTYLLTEDDLDAIRAVEGVSDVEGMYRVILKGTPEDDWAVKWNDCLDEVLQVIDKYKYEKEENV